MSNSLDPDQAQHFVGPDLGPNCLQRLSADGASRQRVKPRVLGFVGLCIDFNSHSTDFVIYCYKPGVT